MKRLEEQAQVEVTAKANHCMISGFRRGVHEIFALLRCHAA
jgi:hypothetical protein